MRALRRAAHLAPALLLAACDPGLPAPMGVFPAECHGPLLQNETFFPDAEVEPFLAVDPADPAHLIGVWQQDRYSGGGAAGLLASISFDAGKTWATASAPFSHCTGGTPVNGGDYHRASDPWVAISPDGTAHQLALAFDGGAGSGHRVILDSGTT